MIKTIKSLGSFNTDQIDIDDGSISISIPFTANNEEVKQIIENKFNTFKTAYPEAANPYYNTFIFPSFGLRTMKPNFNIVVIVSDDELEEEEYYTIEDAEYQLNDSQKEEVKRLIFGKLKKLFFQKT